MRRSTHHENRIQWRKDGSEPISERNDLVYQIENSVNKIDEGIFECHYQHRRDKAPHGLQRLIVRGELPLYLFHRVINCPKPKGV